ncbi:Tf2-9, partial [Mucuna pruriens]
MCLVLNSSLKNLPSAFEMMLEEFKDIFPWDMHEGFPPIKGIKHQIDFMLGVSLPNHLAYRVNLEESKQIQRQVTQLLVKGLVSESKSPFVVPVILAPKKMTLGEYLLIPSRHYIPCLNDLLDEMYGMCVFSKINLQNRYHHIHMKEEDKWKTILKLNSDFMNGFCYAFEANEFPKLMNHVLISLIGVCIVYFDDILVYSSCVDDHVIHVRSVLLLLTKKVCMSLEKCTFCTTRVIFLGYEVGFEGVKVDVEKVKVIQSWPTPKAVKGFRWEESQERAFQALKERQANFPIFALPNFSKTLELECGISNVGVRAVLLQEGHPITYFSEKIKNGYINFSTYDKELYPLEFVINNDHEDLQHLRSQNKLNKRHAKWVEFLEQFSYVIKHKQGKVNIMANALSRRHSLLSLLETKLLGFEHLEEIYLKDEFFLKKFMIFLLMEPMEDNKLCVPKSSIRKLLVKEAHGGGFMEHFREYKTSNTLLQHFFLPYMKKDIHHIYDRCLVYKSTKTKVKPPHGSYAPLIIPIMPWVDLSMDFAVGLPSSKSVKDFIFVVVDRFSRMAHFIPCHKVDDTCLVANLFLREVDSKFLNHFWRTLRSKLGTKLLFSTTCHPQIDYQNEVTNRTLSQLLRYFVRKSLKTLEEWLPKYNLLRIGLLSNMLIRLIRENHKKFSEDGDLVWIHLRNERFSNLRKSKLLPRGDSPFKHLTKDV